MEETLYNLVNSVDRLYEAIGHLTEATKRLVDKQHEDVMRTIECLERFNVRVGAIEEALAKMGGK